MNEKQTTDIPETPPEVEERQKQQTPLTPLAAEDIKATAYLGEDGMVPLETKPANDSFIIGELNRLAYLPPGANPHEGLAHEQIFKVFAKQYKSAPKMDLTMGDLTPEFVVWLYRNHPDDAHVRYHTRIMPSLGVWMMRQHPEAAYRIMGRQKAEQADPQAAPITTPVSDDIVTLKKQNEDLLRRLEQLEAKNQSTTPKTRRPRT